MCEIRNATRAEADHRSLSEYYYPITAHDLLISASFSARFGGIGCCGERHWIELSDELTNDLR
jgi:hypothetical protein